MKKRLTNSIVWKNYGVAIICFVLALCIFGIGMIMKNNWAEQEKAVRQAQAEKIIQAQVSKNRETQAVKTQAAQIVQDVSGINLDRKEKDDRLAAEFVKYAVEWDSYDSYVASRTAFKEKYPYMDEDSYFLSVFFPPEDTMIVRDASNNVVYNVFDNGRNIHFDAMETHVLEISEDGHYKYFATVMCHSDVSRRKRATSHMMCLYTIDSNGIFSDVSVYVLTE